MNIEVEVVAGARQNLTSSRRARIMIWLVLTLLLVTVGCERMPQASSRETIHLLSALRTACSAERPDRLAEVREQVEEAYGDQRLSDAEYEKFIQIIETADAGEWEAAEQACFRFQRAQLR